MSIHGYCWYYMYIRMRILPQRALIRNNKLEIIIKKNIDIIYLVQHVHTYIAGIAKCSKPLDTATCMSQVFMYMQ